MTQFRRKITFYSSHANKTKPENVKYKMSVLKLFYFSKLLDNGSACHRNRFH